MAIKYTNTKGSVIEFDTVEEFQACVNAYKTEDANAEVDMENLPIGTLVKVVDNSAGHCHDAGEILPITEVNEGILDELYRLDGRSVGWVAVEDIEFVSFPEEEESTSGNEEDPDLGFKNGDYAKVLKSNVIFNDGDVIKILDAEGDGHPLAEREDGVDGYAIASQLMKIDKPSGNGDEEVDKDGGFEVGDKAEVISLYSMFTKGEEIVIVEQSGDGTPLARNASGEEWYIPKHKIKKIDEDEDGSEIKAGDTVIATEDEFDITEGVEYEIKEFESGALYFLDDDGDIRHVSDHEERLRKKSDKRGFKRGDVVYVNEEITDYSGDTVCPGVLTEFILDGGVLTPDGTYVVVGDGEIRKLTLVCRAEDRLDK